MLAIVEIEAQCVGEKDWGARDFVARIAPQAEMRI